MGVRGAFSMVTPDEYHTLIQAADATAVTEFLEETDESRSRGTNAIGLMDKAWHGAFCVLPDGLLNTDVVPGLGTPEEFGTQRIYWAPFDAAFLVINQGRVPSIATALESHDEARCRSRYFALAEGYPRPKKWWGYRGPKPHWYAEYVSEDDFDYVLSHCRNAATFFREAAKREMGVIFTAIG